MRISRLSTQRKSLIWEMELLGALIVAEEKEQARYPKNAVVDGIAVGGQFMPDGASYSILKPSDSNVEDAIVNFTQKVAIAPEQFNLVTEGTLTEFGSIVKPLQAQEISIDPNEIGDSIKAYQVAQNELINAETADNVTNKLGNFLKAAAPVATAIAFAVAPEILIPLIAGQGISWGFALGSAALGWAVNMATEKALDMAGIENKWVRLGASAITGLMAGGALSGLRKNLARKTKILKCATVCELKKQDLQLADVKAVKLEQEVAKKTKATIKTLKKEKALEFANELQAKNAQQLQSILGKNPRLTLKTDAEFIAESQKTYNKVRTETKEFYESLAKTKTKAAIEGHTQVVDGKPFHTYNIEGKPYLTPDGQEITLTRKEYMAINRFTLSAKDPLNNVLRGIHGRTPDELANLPSLQAYHDNLISALNRLPRLQPKEPLSRLMTFHSKKDANAFIKQNIKDGILQDKGFITFESRARGGLSFSDEIHKIALNWMSFPGKEKPTPYTVKILVKPSEATKGRYISPVSVSNQYHDLQEFLFKPDTKFKVVDIQKRTLPCLSTKFSLPQRLAEIRNIENSREKLRQLKILLKENQAEIAKQTSNNKIDPDSISLMESANAPLQKAINQLELSIRNLDSGAINKNVDFRRKTVGPFESILKYNSLRMRGDTALRQDLEIRRFSQDPLTNDGTVQNVDKVVDYLHNRFARVITQKGDRSTVIVLEEIDDV